MQRYRLIQVYQDRIKNKKKYVTRIIHAFKLSLTYRNHVDYANVKYFTQQWSRITLIESHQAELVQRQKNHEVTSFMFWSESFPLCELIGNQWEVLCQTTMTELNNQNDRRFEAGGRVPWSYIKNLQVVCFWGSTGSETWTITNLGNFIEVFSFQNPLYWKFSSPTTTTNSANSNSVLLLFQVGLYAF